MHFLFDSKKGFKVLGPRMLRLTRNSTQAGVLRVARGEDSPEETPEVTEPLRVRASGKILPEDI